MRVPEIGNTERWPVLREDHEFSLTHADSEVSLKLPRENVKFVQEPDLDSKTSSSFQHAPTAIALCSFAFCGCGLFIGYNFQDKWWVMWVGWWVTLGLKACIKNSWKCFSKKTFKQALWFGDHFEKFSAELDLSSSMHQNKDFFFHLCGVNITIKDIEIMSLKLCAFKIHSTQHRCLALITRHISYHLCWPLAI